MREGRGGGGSCPSDWPAVPSAVTATRTALGLTRSNSTTRPPRSPVARGAAGGAGVRARMRQRLCGSLPQGRGVEEVQHNILGYTIPRPAIIADKCTAGIRMMTIFVVGKSSSVAVLAQQGCSDQQGAPVRPPLHALLMDDASHITT
eukprot:365625-Chlamydomonas_euryale.AAC.4